MKYLYDRLTQDIKDIARNRKNGVRMVMWQEIMNNNIQVRTVLCKSIAWVGLAEKVKVVEGWWKYFSNMCKAPSQYSILICYF